ncbi:MAG TPA: hypothetical protein VNO22_18250 [Planctomycetota bacterium]|nr:hypothetical protein [Planctomycetota bacterium]
MMSFPAISKAFLLTALQAAGPAEPPPRRPLLSEFVGINGHTVQFRPDLYAAAFRKVRDYHSLSWDLGKDTDSIPRFPEARNRVNWEHVYGSWKKAGFETDVCIMFDGTPPDSWKDPVRDARAYGLAFARFFGPSSRDLVRAVEIGNEPGHYDDATYRKVFEAMARGFREGDPKLRIATCNLTVGKSGRYEKSVSCVAGLEALYDILNIHTYAMAEGWPSWKRSHPEDPKIAFLSSVQALIDWRRANAPGKEIWVTEFGWDACTKPPPAEGETSRWQGNVTDEQQARYLVRSIFLFSSMDVARAYIYFFNDSDEPGLHASSGVTRHFRPKPSFHALAHLQRTLGAYRFERILERREGELYAFLYAHGEDPRRRAIAAWSPTGSGRTATARIPVGTARIERVERMPLEPGETPATEATVRNGVVEAAVGESPLYLFLRDE